MGTHRSIQSLSDGKVPSIEKRIGEVLLKNDGDLLALICQTNFVGNTAANVSVGVLALLRKQQKGTTERFLKRLLSSRVEEYFIKGRDLSDIIRDNSMPTMLLNTYANYEGVTYLSQCISKPLYESMSLIEHCEIDPQKMPENSDENSLKLNIENLQKATLLFVDAILHEKEQMPNTLKGMCKFLNSVMTDTNSLLTSYDLHNVSRQQLANVLKPYGLHSSMSSDLNDDMHSPTKSICSLDLSPMRTTASNETSHTPPLSPTKSGLGIVTDDFDHTGSPKFRFFGIKKREKSKQSITESSSKVLQRPRKNSNASSKSRDSFSERNIKSPIKGRTISQSSISSENEKEVHSNFEFLRKKQQTQLTDILSAEQVEENVKITESSNENLTVVLPKQVIGDGSLLHSNYTGTSSNSSPHRNQFSTLTICDKVVGSFLFLRFFVPAITSPESYGFLEKRITSTGRRGLILIGKILTALCNDVEFGNKEPYMICMNQFLKNNKDRITVSANHSVKSSEEEVFRSTTSDNGEDSGFRQHYEHFAKNRLGQKIQGKSKSILSASLPSLHTASSPALQQPVCRTRSVEFNEAENFFNFLGKSIIKIEGDICEKFSCKGNCNEARSPQNCQNFNHQTSQFSIQNTHNHHHHHYHNVSTTLIENFLELKKLIEQSVYAEPDVKKKPESLLSKLGKMRIKTLFHQSGNQKDKKSLNSSSLDDLSFRNIKTVPGSIPNDKGSANSLDFFIFSFGKLFTITTFGESHCKAVGVILDGCPPGIPLSEEDIQISLNRRRPGQSDLTTPRNEADTVTIMSGCEKGFTLGTPIAMLVNNKDQKPHDYGEMDYYPRPSHADYTYLEKYSIKASSGGGRVSAAAVAEKYLKLTEGIEIVAFVCSVGEINMDPTTSYTSKDSENWLKNWKSWWHTLNTINRSEVDANEVRCPNQETAAKMRKRIVQAKEEHNSIGGTVCCVIRNVPTGLGEPAFDKIEAKLAHAMLSIPATKGFEIGSGFSGTLIPGNIHNDPFYKKSCGKLGTKTNFSGGIQGGITNGEDIYFKVSFKSVATIGQSQNTSTYFGDDGVLAAKGRHDPCVLPRAVPIVEAMSALVVMDALLIQKSRSSAIEALPKDIEIPHILRGTLKNLDNNLNTKKRKIED
ncbi:hypothetical protein HK099_004762 [Clydaea vesicula]|uniref:Chorismate synthase n=1 Tax=Clydaea vesicula TaxID=447962 RepID=A0AAD5U3A0_9FUNG|nr:hypothetical protein HK099_004762 [Clydaea vesicula]